MYLQVLGTIKNAIVVWIGIIFLQELVTTLQVRFQGCSKHVKLQQLIEYGMFVMALTRHGVYCHRGYPFFSATKSEPYCAGHGTNSVLLCVFCRALGMQSASWGSSCTTISRCSKWTSRSLMQNHSTRLCLKLTQSALLPRHHHDVASSDIDLN